MSPNTPDLPPLDILDKQILRIPQFQFIIYYVNMKKICCFFLVSPISSFNEETVITGTILCLFFICLKSRHLHLPPRPVDEGKGKVVPVFNLSTMP